MAVVDTGLRKFTDGAQHVLLSDNQIRLSDGANIDAFSRLRVSYPISIFTHQNSYGTDTDIYETVKSGAGTAATYLPNEDSLNLTVGTVSGEYTIRQTFRYFPYTPGKSQLIVMTGVLGTGVTNITKRIGYFDNSNGLFFEQADSTLKVVRRTFTSGAVVDNAVNQSAWNIDKFDGSGPSGLVIDVSKAQIFVIDFQWLGVGRVRFGFDIDGVIYYCHQLLNANSLTTVYMTTATLPLRYEIRNIGTSAGASLKQICSCVTSEGGTIPEGEQFSASSGITTVPVTTRRPVFAIRLKTTVNSKVNRKNAKLLENHVRATTNDAYIEIIHGHIPTAVTATWTSAGSDSGIEYSIDISAVTFTDEHRVESFYATAGIGQASFVINEEVDVANEHDRIYLDYAGTTSAYFVIYATSFTGTSNIATTATWIES
jgi:hypothetical protein